MFQIQLLVGLLNSEHSVKWAQMSDRHQSTNFIPGKTGQSTAWTELRLRPQWGFLLLTPCKKLTSYIQEPGLPGRTSPGDKEQGNAAKGPSEEKWNVSLPISWPGYKKKKRKKKGRGMVPLSVPPHVGRMFLPDCRAWLGSLKNKGHLP